MSKERNDKEYMIYLTQKPTKSFFVYRIPSKEIFFTEMRFLRKRRELWIEQKRKEGFLTAPVTAMKKDPKASTRKRANELKVHEKIQRKTNKQNLSSDLNPLDYCCVLVSERL